MQEDPAPHNCARSSDRLPCDPANRGRTGLLPWAALETQIRDDRRPARWRRRFVTTDGPRPEDLMLGLRRIHRGVLATLAVCALVIVSQADPTDDGGLGDSDRRYTLAALALGIGSIVARRQAAAPATALRLRVPLAIGALLLAGSIGGVGVALALGHDEREASLLYLMGAAILALRASPTFLPKLAPGSAP
jgi:hypothetical protein